MVRNFIIRFRWLIIVILLAAAGFGYFSYRTAQTNLNKLLDLKRVTIQTRDLQKLVITSGTVVSTESNEILAPGGGKIINLYVSENDKVSKDQLLAKFEVKDAAGRTSKKDVKATRAGTVTKIYAKLNDTVAMNSPLFQVIDLGSLYIQAEVVEADINKIKVGQDATATISALDDLNVSATVNFIGLVPVSALAENPSYVVKLNIKNLPDSLRIGMSADVDITVDSLRGVTSTDDSYIYKKDGKYYVKTYSHIGTVVELNDVEVQLGFKGENGVEIKSGVAAGTEIVLPTDEIKSQRGTFSLFR